MADWVRSKLLFDTVDFFFLAMDMVAAGRLVAMAAELSRWLVLSATAAALRPQRPPSVRPTTLAFSPS